MGGWRSQTIRLFFFHNVSQKCSMLLKSLRKTWTFGKCLPNSSSKRMRLPSQFEGSRNDMSAVFSHSRPSAALVLCSTATTIKHVFFNTYKRRRGLQHVDTQPTQPQQCRHNNAERVPRVPIGAFWETLANGRLGRFNGKDCWYSREYFRHYPYSKKT